MFEINDYIVYGTYGVCKIVDIKYNNNEKEYYILKPLHENLTIKTLVGNTKVTMRRIHTIDEVQKLIDYMKEVEPIWINDVKKRRNKFKELLKTGKCLDLIKVIKTLYLRSRERKRNNQKLTITDKEILTIAKKQLFAEISFVLKIPFNQVENYILKHL